jgi:hypothetical protein
VTAKGVAGGGSKKNQEKLQIVDLSMDWKVFAGRLIARPRTTV